MNAKFFLYNLTVPLSYFCIISCTLVLIFIFKCFFKFIICCTLFYVYIYIEPYWLKTKKITTNKLDLILCGHTHKGQITFFGLYAPILPSKYGQKYRYGLMEKNNAKIYITSGIGTITPPIRFFARPEIVLITLKSF